MSTSYFNYEIDSDMYDNYIDTLNVVAKDNSKTFKIKFDNKKCKNLKNILSKKRDSRYANKNRRIVNKDWKDFNNYQ
jgi:hypothetical protein